jgi:hypothetical protein
MSQYILKPDVVRDCLHRLIEQPIHPMFPGYLCLNQQAQISGDKAALFFPYNDFFDRYLRIKEEGSSYPYFVPFTEAAEPSLANLWFNENVAGTYAPSSLRSTAPLMQIAEIVEPGHHAEWRLKNNHWKLARAEICNGNQLPAESLSAYLLRDYALEFDDPSAFSLVKIFAEEFGYSIGGEQFSHLYMTGDSDISQSSFEKYE